MDKVELLARALQARNRGLTLIFVRTKRSAAKIADDLADRVFAVAAVHGDLGQGAREQALRAFRAGKVDVLVATDVAARGLDVEGITHVINYQAPEDEMTYVHRIGRTARAGASGTAITLVDWDDLPKWKLICDKLDLPFHEPVETYSTSPHLSLELDIPTDATGVLPRADRTRAGLDAEQLEDLGGRAPRATRDKHAPRGRGERPRSDRPRGGDRSRQRTRGGQPVDGNAPAADATPTSTSASADAPRKRRRRRRPSGGSERPASD
jgi:superfamily II DNA/RNA helicase